MRTGHAAGDGGAARAVRRGARARRRGRRRRGELRRLLEVRVPELIAYQDAAYARRLRRLRQPRGAGGGGSARPGRTGRRGGGGALPATSSWPTRTSTRWRGCTSTPPCEAELARALRRADPLLLAPAPAAAPRARAQEEAQARRAGSRPPSGRSAALTRAARHPARPLRLRGGAPRRARARRASTAAWSRPRSRGSARPPTTPAVASRSCPTRSAATRTIKLDNVKRFRDKAAAAGRRLNCSNSDERPGRALNGETTPGGRRGGDAAGRVREHDGGDRGPLSAEAVLKDKDGKQVGVATLIQTAEGVRIAVTGYRLPPGDARAAHPRGRACASRPSSPRPARTSIPAGKQHGTQNPAGPHAGRPAEPRGGASGEGGDRRRPRRLVTLEPGPDLAPRRQAAPRSSCTRCPTTTRRIPPATAARASPAASSRSRRRLGAPDRAGAGPSHPRSQGSILQRLPRPMYWSAHWSRSDQADH